MERARNGQGWKATLYLALGLMSLASSGCLLAVAGVAGGAAAGYAYHRGKVGQEFQAGFPDTWAATHAALVELGMPIVSEEKQADTGFIESRTAENDRVRIYLDSHTSKIPAEGTLTRVGIRVATFGDQPVSDRILYQIGAHLTPTPGGVPVSAPSPQSGEPPLVSSAPKATPTAPPPPPVPLPPQPVRQP